MKKNFAILLAAALLLCLLPGMMPEAKAETFRTTCEHCKTFADHEITGYSRYNDDLHWVTVRCSKCDKLHSFIPVGDPHSFHSGGAETPTCTTGKTCAQCGAQYGKLGHDWGAWQSRGNNSEHIRHCQREGCDAVDTESCSGDSSATCIALGTCTTCGGQYYSDHAFPTRFRWDSDPNVGRDAEKHWLSCPVCHEAKTRVDTHSFVPGTVSSCLKSAATCVSPPIYYVNCNICYYQGTDTYEHPYYGVDPNNHDLVHHDAKVPTCTEAGWEAYDACQREGCIYTTYQEIPVLNHDLVHHDAKAPTCTEAGWNEYDTCQREGCTYTTKVEIPATGHDYTEKVVKPTCEKGGYTLHTCKNCNDSYKDHQTKKLLHWYGEWTNNGDGTNSATCMREDCKHVGKAECAIIEFKQDEATLTLCPICGTVSDGTVLALVEEATAEGAHLPQGELVVRLGEIANGDTLLSVGFEYSGKLTQPKGEVKVTLPAELLSGHTLSLLNADGTETELPFTAEDETAAFTLDFADGEIPAGLIRLIPVGE